MAHTATPTRLLYWQAPAVCTDRIEQQCARMPCALCSSIAEQGDAQTGYLPGPR